MRSIILALLLATMPAFAGDQMVYKSDRITVHLTMNACDIAPLTQALIAAESETPPRVAIILYGQTEVPGCWGSLQDKVLIADVLGAAGFILKESFKPERGA